jgi:organic radical activating enzyme
MIDDKWQYKIIPEDLNTLNDDLYIFDLNILYKCNFKCSYCYNKELLKLDKFIFDVQQLRLLLSAIEQNIDNSKYKIKFHILGGEPTLHPELDKIILEILNNKNINLDMVKLFSNGSLIDKYVDMFKQYTQVKNKKLDIYLTYHAEKIQPKKFIEKIEYLYDKGLDFTTYILINPEYKEYIDYLSEYMYEHQNFKYVYTILRNSEESVKLFYTYKHKDNRSLDLVEINKNNDIIWKCNSNKVPPGKFFKYNCLYLKRVFTVDPRGIISRECFYGKKFKEKFYIYPNNFKKLLKLSNRYIICENENNICPCDVSHNYAKYK